MTIEGITEQMMFHGGPQGATIEAIIRANCDGLVSIERTNHLNSRGKWHFLVQIQHQHTVRQYILQQIIPNLERNGLPSINGIAAGVSGSLLGTTTVGNYAEVLKRNLSTNANDFNQESLNTNVFQKRK